MTAREARVLHDSTKILEYLRKNEGKKTQREIIDGTGIRQPDVSKALAYLVEHRHVTRTERQPSPKKRLRYWYQITVSEPPMSSAMVK